MAAIRRMVLDVLKPHKPTIVEVAEAVSDTDGVKGANAILVEIDEEVQNIKMTIEGEDIEYEAVKDTIEELGGSIHSIDEIVCGETIVEESKTPQD